MPHPIFGKARTESKDAVQHVESDNGGELHQSDFHDSDTTLVSYEGGKEIHRNRNHPLLKKYEPDMNTEEG